MNIILPFAVVTIQVEHLLKGDGDLDTCNYHFLSWGMLLCGPQTLLTQGTWAQGMLGLVLEHVGLG